MTSGTLVVSVAVPPVAAAQRTRTPYLATVDDP
jgi:hypothetical protein